MSKFSAESNLSHCEIDALRCACDADDSESGFCINAKRLVQVGYHVELARGALRALVARGFVKHQRGLFNDDGNVAGSGYGITPAGRLAMTEIERQVQK